MYECFNIVNSFTSPPIQPIIFDNLIFLILSSECQQALGMESGAIPIEQISASSQWDVNHAVIQSRLNFKAKPGKAGSWSARRNDANQWLQIDTNNQLTNITGVATQGMNGYRQWVTRYQLQYSDDGKRFQYYKEEGKPVFKVKGTCWVNCLFYTTFFSLGRINTR